MKKIFLALMAVAAIALTGCKGKNVVSLEAAIEYAQLCDKLFNLPQSEVSSEMDKAGWVEVGDKQYVLKSKKAAYNKSMKKGSTVNDFVAIGAMIYVSFENEVCKQASLQCLYTDAGNAKSTFVKFSDFIQNKDIDKSSFYALLDDTEYKEIGDRPTFIQDVKNKDWKNVSESFWGREEGFASLGSVGEGVYYIFYDHHN